MRRDRLYSILFYSVLFYSILFYFIHTYTFETTVKGRIIPLRARLRIGPLGNFPALPGKDSKKLTDRRPSSPASSPSDEVGLS